MRIVIIHYHLNPGGVTRVVQSQINSILQAGDYSISLIAGKIPESFTKLNIETKEIPLLNYLESGLSSDELRSRLDGINTELKKCIDKSDILHVHNLNLGKNPLMTLAFSRMIQEGYKVLNHSHDFAEDRPDLWQFLKDVIAGCFHEDLASVLYPEAKNSFYGVLNRADWARLKGFDIPKERIFYLPNPVRLSKPDAKYDRAFICNKLKLDCSKKIVTYPVRVIRRKNIGEFILLSVLFQEQANWVVTLPPKNPVEVKAYNSWKSFCLKHDIHVCFEAGLDVKFEPLISVSDFCITTSAREGFGLVYLEPWLLGTPVVGRNISDVTDDLQKSGLRFDRLYEQIKVNWDGNQDDFKTLKPAMQKHIILSILKGQTKREEVFAENPFLENLLQDFPPDVIEANKKTVINEYSTEVYGKRLSEAYKKISG